jgi:hypothetical protein
MQLGELRAGFPWGVLLVSDSESKEQIPSWDTPEEQVAAASTAMVVRVLHQDNGEASVRVLDEAADARGELTFSGMLSIPSKTLRVSDALGEASIDIEVPSGRSSVSVYTDDPMEASVIDLVVNPALGDAATETAHEPVA